LRIEKLKKTDNTMIEKIDNSQIQPAAGGLEKLSPKGPNPGEALPNNGVDVSLQLDYASFIDKATKTTQTDTNAVERAQELLLSGQLESSQNTREAAENILKFGI